MEQPNLVQPAPAFAPPKKKSRLGLILGIAGGAIVLCIAFFLILFLVVLKATAPAADVGQSFMEALKAGNYRTAYGMCTPELKSEIGSADDLGALLEDNGAIPQSWSFTSRNVENDQAQLQGTGTFSGGQEADIEIILAKVGDAWLVAGFNFNWK